MKTFSAFVFAILLAVPSLALAQETAPPADGVTPLKAGTTSLVFSFGGFGNAGLTGGQFLAGAPADNNAMDPTGGVGAQYGIGGRYYINDQLAVRGTLALQNTSRDVEGGDSSYFMLGLGGGVMYHLLTSGKVSLYTGGLLGFYTGSYEEEGEDDVDITGFGLYGLLGAEYYISANFSLGAEYMLGFTSTGAEQGDFEMDFSDFSVQTFSFHLGFHF